MESRKERNITLKHLVLGGQKMIGIQFYPDKVIQAVIKQLPNPRWSPKYQMVVLCNNQKNLTAIFSHFKGVAWINTKHFFVNRPINNGNEKLSVDAYRKRPPKQNWKYCPEEFYQKLEIRKYSLHTARVYIPMFERFINYFSEVENPMDLSEMDIKKYLQHLVIKKKSDSYINQSINAINPVGLK